VLDKVIGHVFIQEVLEKFHQTQRDLKLIHAVFIEIFEKRRHKFEFFLFDQNGNNDVQRRDYHRRPQSPAICCSVLQCVAVSACPLSPTPTVPRHLLQCVVCFSVSVRSHQSIGMLYAFAKSNIEYLMYLPTRGSNLLTVGWLRLVGSIKLQVSFAKEPYKRDDILQMTHVIVSILLTVATPCLAGYCVIHFADMCAQRQGKETRQRAEAQRRGNETRQRATPSNPFFLFPCW